MRDRQRRPLSELRPRERNYNRGDVHAIAASIQRWGFNGALRVWDGSLDEPGTVIAGNHTYLALLQLKDEGAEPPMHVGIAGDGDWQVATADADTTGDHPTSKPTALWELPIEQHTSRGDLIYEPFSGSGTALVAAERTGRIAYACELQPAFVAVALDRLTQMGLAPRLESTEPVTETVTEQ